MHLWQLRPGREGRPDGIGAPATTAMWPAVLHGGRPTKEAVGQLPAGSTLMFGRRGTEAKSFAGRPATGRWRTKWAAGGLRNGAQSETTALLCRTQEPHDRRRPERKNYARLAEHPGGLRSNPGLFAEPAEQKTWASEGARPVKNKNAPCTICKAWRSSCRGAAEGDLISCLCRLDLRFDDLYPHKFLAPTASKCK